MPTPKETFESKMNALATSINTKAGTSGAKDLDALKTAVDSITLPKLYAPTISASQEENSVFLNSSYNGAFGQHYKVFYNGVYAMSGNLEGWDGDAYIGNAESGTKITITIYSPDGDFIESDPSNEITIS